MNPLKISFWSKNPWALDLNFKLQIFCSVFLHNELIPLLSELFNAEPSSMFLSMIGMDRFSPPNSHFQLLIRSLQLILHFHCTGIDVQQLQEVCLPDKIMKIFEQSKEILI